MNILLQLLLFIIGLFVLIKSADLLIEHSVLTAGALKISSLLIGITVVAFGTSAPELFVSTVAALQQKPDISVGNIIGSCIANITLVIGATALLKPIDISPSIAKVKTPWFLAVLFIISILMFDLQLSRSDGLILLTCFVIFILASVIKDTRTEQDNIEQRAGPSSLLKNILLIIAGLGGLVIGAELFIRSSSAIAKILGISELIIGITVVALGTSLPELVTSVVASYKNEHDISLANVIGSNIFNILLVLGVVATITPLAINKQVIQTEIWILYVISFFMWFLFLFSKKIQRLQGILLLSIYFLYLGYLFIY